MIAFAIILAAVALIAVAEGITVVAFMAAASCAEQAEQEADRG